MYLQELQDVLDAVALVNDYHNKPAIKELVKTRFIYKNNVTPVSTYINKLISFSSFFQNQWTKTVTGGKELGPRRLWNDAFKDTFQNRLDQFLEECYANQSRLNQIRSDAIATYTLTNKLTPEQQAYLRHVQTLQGEAQQSGLLDFINKQLKKKKKSEPKIKYTKGIYGARLSPEELAAQRKIPVNLENLGQPLPQTPHPSADLVALHANEEPPTAKQAGIPIEQIRQRAQSIAFQGRKILLPAADELFSRGKVVAIRAQPVKQAGNLAGYFLRQVPFLSGLGGGAGSNISYFPSRNTPYSKGIYGARLNPFQSRGSSFLTRGLAARAKLWFMIVAGIIGFILLFFFMDVINPNASLCPPWEGCNNSLGSDVGVGSGGNIAACTFTRAGQSHPIKSTKLMGYIQEVSAKSGVPAAVIAGVAMHENQDFVSNATDDHAAFGTDVNTSDRCNFFATSSTGALGMMQIQPPQTILPIAHPGAWSKDGITRGLQLMDPSRTFDSLTMRDFCDVRSSVYLGAGVLISKNGGKPPTSGEEIKTAVCRYYGATCIYGNNFNYGEEVRKDWESCQSNIALPPGGGGAPTQCTGASVSFGAPKHLLPLPNERTVNGARLCSSTDTGSCGRPGSCRIPTKIVLHVTGSIADAQSTFLYFANGSEGRGVGSHFIIGRDGQVIQAVELLENQVEIAYAVAAYSDHISIEMVSPVVYNSKNEVPTPQYQATFSLVKDLMQRYKIPLGNLEFDWRSPSDAYNPLALPGIYGHYQLNPRTRSDPGAGLMRDFREELRH